MVTLPLLAVLATQLQIAPPGDAPSAAAPPAAATPATSLEAPDASAVPPAPEPAPVPERAPVPAAAPLMQPVAGVDATVVMSSGGRWTGRVTSVREDMVVVGLDEDRQVELKRDKVRGVVPRAWLQDDVVAHGTLRRGAGPDTRLLLVSGEVVRGLVVERSADRLVVLVEGDARREIPVEQLLAELPLREARPPPGGRSRYLEAPSAILPVAGQVEVSAVQGVHLAATAGLTSFLTLSAGTVVPALHAEDYGDNVQAALRAGLSLGERWHLAGGLHLSRSGSGRSAGYLSATATWASPDLSVSVHAGPTFPGLNELSDLGDTGMALCASLRLGPRFAVISETWAGLKGEGVFSALAVRYVAWRLTLDGGLAAASGGEVYPWLGVAMEVHP